MQPPKTTAVSIKEKDSGVPTWALQRATNAIGLFGTLTEDGQFGAKTARVIRSFQDLKHLVADAKAGPKTQAALARHLISIIDGSLPGGLLLSVIDGESGCFIAAVNWNVAGGVDCGYTQRRILGPPFKDDEVRRAFDSHFQISLLRTQLKERFTAFRSKPAVHSDERAYRVAVLAHNWPAGAKKFSEVPESKLSAYYTTTQDWVKNIGAKFPTGERVLTPLDWARRYSLGDASRNEPGQMVKLVEW